LKYFRKLLSVMVVFVVAVIFNGCSAQITLTLNPDGSGKGSIVCMGVEQKISRQEVESQLTDLGFKVTEIKEYDGYLVANFQFSKLPPYTGLHQIVTKNGDVRFYSKDPILPPHSLILITPGEITNYKNGIIQEKNKILITNGFVDISYKNQRSPWASILLILIIAVSCTILYKFS